MGYTKVATSIAISNLDVPLPAGCNVNARPGWDPTVSGFYSSFSQPRVTLESI